MRLGVSISSTHPTDDARDGARYMIERTQVANQAGLDSLSIGDHHAMSIPYFQNLAMLGRLLAEWDRDRPAGCLFLLPLWNPVIVAESIGTLAAMLDAPFIFQSGIGYGEEQFAALGAEHHTRGRVTDDSMKVVRGLLAGERVSSSRFGLVDAVICPTPHTPVQWWVGGGRAKPIERAAREGEAWYAGPWATASQMSDMIDTYRAACARYATTPQICMRKDVIVLRDANRAKQLGTAIIDSGYRGLDEASLVIGGVDEAVDSLARFGEAGVDEVVVRCMSIDQNDALETLELCGEVRRQLIG